MFVHLPTMATVKGRNGVDVGALVCQALQKIGMQHKQAWLIQGYPNGSQWSKAIRGEAPLDWWSMRLLPSEFWEAFLPLFASAKIREWLVIEQESQRLHMAKAELKPVIEERKSA